MHDLHAVQGLQPIAQDVWNAWHHHPLDCCALDLVQPVDHHQLVQEVEESIKQPPVVQPVHPFDDLLAVQAPGDPRVIAASRLPTSPFGQILCHRFSCLFHRPPPSVDDFSRYGGKWATHQGLH
jgi:hypothetical protein